MDPQPTSDDESLSTPDGTRLYGQRYAAAGGAPRGAAVVIHGFSSHLGLHGHVAAALAADGWAARTFDCRGHGRSGGRPGYVRRFTDYVGDLELILERARRDAPGRPLALVAHSHGATIALEMLLAGRQTCDWLVMAAPYLSLRMKVPAYKRVLSRLVGGVWPTLTMTNGIDPAQTCSDAAMCARMASDPLVHHVATPRWFNEVRAAQAHILANGAALKVPALMLLAGEDRLVENEASLQLARSAPAVIEVKQYQGLFHEMFLEPERERVIADIVAWLRQRSPR